MATLRVRFLVITLLGLFTSPALAGGVRIVTAAGELNFSEIQQAVDAAAEGDVLLVAEGSYGGFAVDGKSLSVFAVPGADVRVACSVHIRNLAAGQTVVLAGLQVVSSLGGCGNNGMLWLEDNQGFVRVQDCSFTGWSGSYTTECISAIPGNDATWIIDCASVALLDTTLTGGEGEWQDSYNGTCDAAEGGLGLLAVRSNLALYECGITGGLGGQAKYHAGVGGAGVEAVDSEVFASGGWIQGGAGGLNYDSGIYTYATGGDALSLTAGSLHSMDCVVSGGPGQPPGQILTGTGSYNVLPAQARSLQGPTVVVSGTPFSANYAGVAGDLVSVSLAEEPGHLLLLALSGVLLTPFPATWLGPYGVASANGSLSFPLSFAPLAAGEPHGSLVVQGLAGAAGGQFLAGARHALVLSLSIGPDCNGNGTSDYLDVITGHSPDTNHNLIPDTCEPPVQNGGFEQPALFVSNLTISAGSTALDPWTVTGGGLDLVHTLWDPAEGLNSISLNGVGPSTITQTVSTLPGTSYSLGFAMAAEIFGGPPVRQIDVLWNGVLVDTVSFDYTGQGPNSMGWEDHQYTLVGTGLDVLSFVSLTSGPYGPALDNVTMFRSPHTYCAAGTSASGCHASLAATGTASASAASGFDLRASSVEGLRDGIFFFGTNGQQTIPWGNGTSYQCVAPPVSRAGLLTGVGTSGECDGSFSQDLNELWTATPPKNPGAGAVVQAQLWYRDPFNTSNRTTSLSDAIEFTVAP